MRNGSGPAAGQGPQAFGALPHEKDLILFKDHSAHVGLGGGVTLFFFEDAANYGEREVTALGEDLGGELTEGLVAFDVERVFGEGEAVLGDGLEPFGPVEPEWFLRWRHG